jgi:hypothetical protein
MAEVEDQHGTEGAGRRRALSCAVARLFESRAHH